MNKKLKPAKITEIKRRLDGYFEICRTNPNVFDINYKILRYELYGMNLP